VEPFKSYFQISKSNWVFEKDVILKHLFDYRKWNTLAFRGRLMSLLELRSAGSHRGLFSRWSLAYSSCWARFSFSTSCFNYSIHSIIIYMILSFVNSKRYPVDWNGRRRLLGLRLLAPPKTLAGIANVLPWDERQCSPMSLETPQ